MCANIVERPNERYVGVYTKQLDTMVSVWDGYAGAADLGRWRPSSVGLFRSDTAMSRLPHLLISDKLFDNIYIYSTKTSICSAHSSHQKRNQHYSLRQRSHNLQLPIRTSALK